MDAVFYIAQRLGVIELFIAYVAVRIILAIFRFFF